MARLVGYTVVGVDPSIMGIGPSPAIKQLLKENGKTLEQIDFVEVYIYSLKKKSKKKNIVLLLFLLVKEKIDYFSFLYR